MNNKRTALVLGGVVPHIALINDLKAKGYYTILIDYLENPPARSAADEHIQESTLDIDKVVEIAKNRNVDLVVGLCVDQANITSSYVSEALNLPKSYSYETSLLVTDKGKMKEIMVRNGIPTANYIVVESKEQLKDISLKFPVVVKPVDNNGSKGVKKVFSLDGVVSAVEYALSISRAGRAIIEDFNYGQEIQIDCFVNNNQTDVLMVKKRFKITNEDGHAMQSFGSIVPAGISDELQTEICRIAKKIVKAFGLNNTPFFIQAIVNDNKISVLEFAPRIGGTTSFSMIKMVTGFDIILESLNALLGEERQIKYSKPNKYVSTVIIYAYAGTFGCIKGYEELLQAGVVEEFYVSKTTGMELGTQMDSRNRVASFIISGESKDDIIWKANNVLDSIEVYDINGCPIMRRDLYPTIEMI